MLKHYTTVAFRNLGKHRSFSLVNIAGLALGITCFTLIALYVQYELSFDRFHSESSRIYRVIQQRTYEDQAFSRTGAAHAVALVQDFPEFEEVVRVSQIPVEVQRMNAADAVRQEEAQFHFADSNFFEVFSFPLLAGDVRQVLTSPKAMVLTESTAKRYFGDEDPLGQTIRVGSELELEVQGIMADTPSNSHLKIDFLASVDALKQYYHFQGEFTSYWWPWLWTYVKLAPQVSAVAVNERLKEFNERHREPGAKFFVPELQPLTDIHLYSNTMEDPTPGGSITYVAILSAISLLILFIACVNFTNLSLARSAKRAKEVGVRKAAGAGRSVLIHQFLGESLIISVIALIIGWLAAELLLPFFNELANRPLSIDLGGQLSFWSGLLAVVLVTGLLAGSYPAWVLSGVNAARVLKGQVGMSRSSGTWLQRSLVVFQFVASIALIAGTLIAYQQLRYLQEAALGFNQERVLTVAVPGDTAKIASTEQAFRQLAGVQQVSRVFSRPGFGNGVNQVYEAEDSPRQLESGDRIWRQHVGYDYFALLDVPVVAGRTFSEASGTDATEAVVLNEAAVAQLGYTTSSAIGKKVRTYVSENGQTYGDLTGTVIGVVQNYHGTLLRDPIQPTVFMTDEGALGSYTNYLLVKTSGDVREVMATMERQWKTVFPDRYFEASFLDAELALRYAEEQRLGKIMLTFSVLAILIACLGLYGLASYLAERRTKEIGIRKTLGASVQQLLILFNQDFVRLILIALVIAIPLTYYAMNRWLQGFAYHIDIGAAVFVVAGLLCLVIALATVSYQSLRAAWMDPVDALRNE